MIVLEGIEKRYQTSKKNEVVALQDIHLTIQEKEMVAIMGSSGAGKTTLLNIISTLDVPTKGTITYNNIAVDSLNDTKRSRFRADHIGIVLQQFALLLEERIRTNVELPLAFVSKKRTECLKTDEVLKRCGLSSFGNRRVKELSGGQMQRVAIARALITNPDLIVADEPTGSLDKKSSEEILLLLQDLHAMGKTILIVTHDPTVAKYCDRLLRIEDGKIVEDTKINA